jgi:uncharacterized protein
VFGSYRYPVSLSHDGISINVTADGKFARYIRECGGNRVEKILGATDGTLLVNPVEPTNLPENITGFLEISFPSIVLKPGSFTTIYLTFPIEIAVFLEANNLFDVFDLFSLTHTKFSLYGPPDAGPVTRWYRSGVYSSLPQTDPLREGVMELRLQNSSPNSLQVSRGIFENTAMALWYGEIVSLVASMNVFSETLAETRFFDKPLQPGMKRSTDMFTARKIPVVQNASFFMEFGVT